MNCRNKRQKQANGPHEGNGSPRPAGLPEGKAFQSVSPPRYPFFLAFIENNYVKIEQKRYEDGYDGN